MARPGLPAINWNTEKVSITYRQINMNAYIKKQKQTKSGPATTYVKRQVYISNKIFFSLKDNAIPSVILQQPIF